MSRGGIGALLKLSGQALVAIANLEVLPHLALDLAYADALGADSFGNLPLGHAHGPAGLPGPSAGSVSRGLGRDR